MEQISHVAKKSDVCTLEIINGQLICFIPVKETTIEGLIEHEKIAYNFADILLKRLHQSNMTTIGDISPTLNVNAEAFEEDVPETPQEKKSMRRVLILMGIFSVVILISPTIIAFESRFQYVVMAAFILFLPIFLYLLPEKARKDYLKKTGWHVVNRR